MNSCSGRRPHSAVQLGSFEFIIGSFEFLFELLDLQLGDAKGGLMFDSTDVPDTVCRIWFDMVRSAVLDVGMASLGPLDTGAQAASAPPIR